MTKLVSLLQCLYCYFEQLLATKKLFSRIFERGVALIFRNHFVFETVCLYKKYSVHLFLVDDIICHA